MFHLTAISSAKCLALHPIPSPSPPTHAHPRAVGVLSISLMFQTLKFMLFSGLTPRQGAPRQHHGSGPHGLSLPAAAMVPQYPAGRREMEDDQPHSGQCHLCPVAVGTAQGDTALQAQGRPGLGPSAGLGCSQPLGLPTCAA